MSTYLRVDNARFTYKSGHVALQDVSFRMGTRDKVAILGPSGCGKTTLLRLIAGLVKLPSEGQLSGEITIDECSCYEYLSRRRTSFMFQEPTLLPHLTVERNIALPQEAAGSVDSDRCEMVMEMVGLSRFRNSLPRTLSGGMRTRVALARSFVIEPALLLLDEPFSSLDIGWKHELYAELEALLLSNQATLLIVTHDPREAVRVAERAIVLSSTGVVVRDIDFQINADRSSLEKELEAAVLEGHPSKLS